MARFIQAAHRAPRLSGEEERALGEQARAGSKAARDRLVTSHLRQVVFVALKYRRYGVPLGDLVSEGNVGLLRAVDKFDPSRGVRFATYATHWIRSYIVSHVLASWSVVCPRTGVLRSKTFFKLRRERAKLEALGLDGTATNLLLAQNMGVSPSKVERMLARVDARDLSLEAPAHHDSRASLGDLIDAGDDPEKVCDEHRMKARLAAVVEQALASLDERERYIAGSRWLADPDEEITLAEVGRKLGVSRERARQLEARARQRFTAALAKAGGIDRAWLDATAA